MSIASSSANTRLLLKKLKNSSLFQICESINVNLFIKNYLNSKFFLIKFEKIDLFFKLIRLITKLELF
ncbi:hypothetical protein BpHYR1_020175 [Brachionus plicatilis]|uniref:Uncharacterized protein n=1 Tax=Brachionus plicatilis TaxID=10195 RepID=A0A3M7QQ89_BRAPC|nr:hypothetical protein BpHYR1_020175 [Brachionus plicatilis]